MIEIPYMCEFGVQVFRRLYRVTGKEIRYEKPELFRYVHPVQVFDVVFSFGKLFFKLIGTHDLAHVVRVPIAASKPVLVGNPVLRLDEPDVLIVPQDSEVVPHLSERPGTELPDILPLKDDLLFGNSIINRPFVHIALDNLKELSSSLREIIEGTFKHTVGQKLIGDAIIIE